LDSDAAKVAAILARLKELGIDLDAATKKLEEEGVQKFAKAFDGLMKALKEKQSLAQPLNA
jgi:transaldolase/transaldolase/glucose-6-phosphate isomerase